MQKSEIMRLFCISVRVFREPIVPTGDNIINIPSGSGSEIEVGHVTYCDEVPSAAQSPSTDFSSSLWQYLNCIWQSSGPWYIFGILTVPAEAAVVCSGSGDISTEAETRSQIRRRRAIVTRRLMPLCHSALFSVASGSHERSREVLEEAFVNGVYCVKWRSFLWCSITVPDFCNFSFRLFQYWFRCNSNQHDKTSTCYHVSDYLGGGEDTNSATSGEQ